MKQQQVFLARFPFSNQADYKIRPIAIISNNKLNEEHNFVWACPITTKQTKPEFELEIREKDFTGELKSKSFVRTDTIATMEKTLILKQIGEISKPLFEKLKTGLIKNL
ncbi:MAG: type II toxin-antitoxin system PemK/MazF family toxin [Candidatus ainarchaeum sp.]|nr:type II toxin-antitoxin system PemK/MazF family toxin [Candidatus ainarchaeum sp.]